MQFSPNLGDPAAGVLAMEEMFAQLVPPSLPEGVEWLEHLDLLDAVRLDRVQNFVPFDDYWVSKTPGYASVGLPSDSPDVTRADEEFLAQRLRAEPVAHEFKEGFVRLPFPHAKALQGKVRAVGGYSDAEIERAGEIARTTFQLETIDPAAKQSYMKIVREQPIHRRLAEWWAALPNHFSVTSVGRVLARTNAKRLDVQGLLPPID